MLNCIATVVYVGCEVFCTMTHCASCVEETPEFQTIAEDYPNES